MSPSPECHSIASTPRGDCRSEQTGLQAVHCQCVRLVTAMRDNCVGIRVVAISSGQYHPLVGWTNDRLVSGLDR
jgi:hypothetical protein